MTLIGKSKRKTNNGFETEVHQYSAQNCNGCSLRGLCHKATTTV